jgi:hypothetical protein
MRATILEYIPPETTLEEAQEFMEDEGFECRLLEVDGTRAEPEDTEYYLYCDRHDRVDLWVSRRWQVSIGLEDDRVTDVGASEGYVGP